MIFVEANPTWPTHAPRRITECHLTLNCDRNSDKTIIKQLLTVKWYFLFVKEQVTLLFSLNMHVSSLI